MNKDETTAEKDTDEDSEQDVSSLRPLIWKGGRYRIFADAHNYILKIKKNIKKEDVDTKVKANVNPNPYTILGYYSSLHRALISLHDHELKTNLITTNTKNDLRKVLEIQMQTQELIMNQCKEALKEIEKRYEEINESLSGRLHVLNRDEIDILDKTNPMEAQKREALGGPAKRNARDWSDYERVSELCKGDKKQIINWYHTNKNYPVATVAAFLKRKGVG